MMMDCESQQLLGAIMGRSHHNCIFEGMVPVVFSCHDERAISIRGIVVSIGVNLLCEYLFSDR
jgi:hypothetical protein